MAQPFTNDQRSSFPYLNPVIKVTAAGQEIGPYTAKFGVASDVREKADTCTLMVSDTGRRLEGSLKRGDPIVIAWGYTGEELTEIFRGVIREIGSVGSLVIRGIDENVRLNSVRVNTTFHNETIAGIVKAIMPPLPFELKIDQCDATPDCFPGFGRTVRECLDELNQIALRETGEAYFDYIRGGVFNWGRKRTDGKPVMSFESGVNLIRLEPAGGELTMLETMVAPVQHSQVIEVDNKRRYVLRCEYFWDGGGRTRIWSERAR
jgi:hypothetical protein